MDHIQRLYGYQNVREEDGFNQPWPADEIIPQLYPTAHRIHGVIRQFEFSHDVVKKQQVGVVLKESGSSHFRGLVKTYV